MAKNHLRTQIGQEQQNGHKSVHGLWQPQEATRSTQSKDSLPVQGKTFPSSMHPILKDPGVVHIWYNIPLCTISSSNPMVTYSGPNPSPILKEDLSAISAWQFPGSYQKTIQGSQPPGPAGVGLSFSHQDYSKGSYHRLSIS
ncbi:hypothetical protein O181_095045 [Austropuccinia psidii MF-1]|uniref:Uncharacterized protein n=1 Tax=Austropuccinia psidii MF-1 TaxID=1389203 RepID=A0A9Q3J347_9BASI|nr:hypothetical protein [Austropuccinia psidii MF-1]